MMKIFFRFDLVLHAMLVFVSIILITSFPAHAQEKPVLVYGDTLATSSSFRQALQREHTTPVPINSLDTLDTSKSQLLILASENKLLSSSGLALSRYLKSGGNVIVVGTRNFYGTTQPVREVPLGSFAEQESYSILMPDKGKSKYETPQIETVAGPEGKSVLRLKTSNRIMLNTYIQFPTVAARSARRNVVTFAAKGDAYMDIMSLIATDDAGKKYFALVPISQQWQKYAVSLADFIPENWNDPSQPYPLIDPASIKTLELGTTEKTLLGGKPMEFFLGQVNLAEEKNNVYAPTAALNRLAIPFQQIGIVTPQWIFDPFYGSQPASSASLISVDHPKSTFNVDSSWICPPEYDEFPDPKSESDMEDRRQLHSLRRKVLFETSDSNKSVAENRLFTGGPLASSNIALFGFAPQQITQTPVLLKALSQTVDQIINRPRIAQVKFNTTAQQGDSPICPVLEIRVKNPLDHSVNANLKVNVGRGKLAGKVDLVLPANCLTIQRIQLNTVPSDFNFAHFEWQTTLESEAGTDVWKDVVDAERTLLQSIVYMANVQKIYPDGRITTHFFADVYGVRAMFAYLKYLEKHPDHLQHNQDLWKQITPEQIRASAERFADMLVRRQSKNGAVPMGYSEHTAGFNVADGGQIAVGLSCMAFDVDDPVRHEQYLLSARKLIDYAETFYIDSQGFEKLQKEAPQLIKQYGVHPGYYGLGVHRRHNAGPLWVLGDVLAAQAALSYAFPEGPYGEWLERNVRVYLDHAGPVVGWYQAEALSWSLLTVKDLQLRQRIAAHMKKAFLPQLFEGKEGDMFDSGARGTLRGLSLAYYRQYLGDSANERAALLKYAWAAGSETSSDSVARLARQYTNPHHGSSLAAIKFAEFSSIWAMELLEPGSSLLQIEGFPINKH